MERKQTVDTNANTATVDLTCRINLAALPKVLSPHQIAALLCGIGQVTAALPKQT